MRITLHALLCLLIAVPPAYAGDLGPSLQLEIRFDSGRKTEFLLNGMRIQKEPQRQQEKKMTCPEEGSCVPMVLSMTVAVLLGLYVVSEVVRHRD